MNTTPRMQFSFPTVATIRKGGPKKKNAEGKLIQGDDLEDKFRVVFFPGAEEYRALFIASQPALAGQPADKPLLVTRLHAMMPFAKTWDSLEIWNEAYQAGRMVVRATDTQVITRRDPLTGEYLVRDGQPYEAYDPQTAKAITYERGGKPFTLPMRTSVRLKLFLPEVQRMVTFELKSTSYYDALNLRQQMGAIQVLADMLNGGVAGGIPFWVFRRQQEICWNKKDGSAQRIRKWLVNVEVDAEWVAAATRRMAGFALTGQQLAGLLQPTTALAGEEDPATGIDDPEEEIFDQEPVEAGLEMQSLPPIDPPVVEVEEPAPADPSDPQAVLDAAPQEKGKLVRPMTPAVLRAALAVKVSKLNGRQATEKQISLLRMLLEQVFAGEEKVIQIRHSVTGYLIGVESLNDATGAQVQALLDWLAPVIGSSGEYLVDQVAARELRSVWTAALEAAGQMKLF